MSIKGNYTDQIYMAIWAILRIPSAWNLSAFFPPNQSPIYLEPNWEPLIKLCKSRFPPPSIIGKIILHNPQSLGRLIYDAISNKTLSPVSIASIIQAEPKRYLQLSDASIRAFCSSLAKSMSKERGCSINVYHEAVKEFLENNIWKAKDSESLMRIVFAEFGKNGKKYFYTFVYSRGGGVSDAAQSC